MAKVLVVDDEESIRQFLEILLSRLGHDATCIGDAPAAIAEVQKGAFDLVLTDLRLPTGSGMDVLRYAHENAPNTQVIMMTAFATTENAVEAMKLGAYDYVIKPFQVDEITVLIDRALERRELREENKALKKTLEARAGRHRLLGASPPMREVFNLIGKVAATRTTVLITGESGTGKELVARAIHTRSPRVDDPFVPVNCGAIPEQLIESELFGHIKGSFTGAHADKAGLFEAAANGTVFLDEIGELPMSMQVKLLRVLQERSVRRVGDTTDKDVKCRVIAATNRDLEVEVEEGRFRQDLYFRLNVIQLPLPPLRDRRVDIPILLETFMARFAEDQGSIVSEVSAEAMRRIMAYDWPGNVRELENVVERGVTLAADHVLDVSVLPKKLQNGSPPPLASAEGVCMDLPEEGIDLESFMEDIERSYIRQALARTDGKKGKAAELLGLSFRSFRYRVAKLDMQ